MENRQALAPLQILWDYLGMHQKPEQADCIVGFGNFNDNIARRAAELYRAGYAPYVLFTGGLGRNTLGERYPATVNGRASSGRLTRRCIRPR